MGQVLELRKLTSHLLSQVASSLVAEMNWYTFSFIHSIKRKMFTSKRVEKLVYVHSSIIPEGASQIHDDDDGPPLHTGLVNVPLDDIELQLQGIDDDETKESKARTFLYRLHPKDLNL